MKLIILKTIFISIFLCSQAMTQEQSQNVTIGNGLSVEHCSRCHVVDPKRPFTGISSTPSFKLMVNELDDWEDRFSSFFARLPHPSVVRFKGDEPKPNVEDLIKPVIIDPDDIDALVAYARTLLE